MQSVFWTGRLSLPMSMFVNVNNALALVLGKAADVRAMKTRVRSGYEGRSSQHVRRYDELGLDLQERSAEFQLRDIELAGKSVLDIGSGTGENALFYASEGHEVWGIDAVPRAIDQAREKAAERGLPVQFLVLDALHMATLGRTFDSVTDSGFFHTLSDADRPVYVDQLAAVLSPGGHYFMLCFSNREPPGYGPPAAARARWRMTWA